MNTWTPDSIASHILFRGALIVRAIIALDDLQTRDEAVSRQTFIKNGVGWAANDAPRASRLAARLRDDSKLSADDFGLAAYLIERYRVQLCWMANKKGSGPRFAHLSEGLFVGRGNHADYWYFDGKVSRRVGHSTSQKCLTLSVEQARKAALFAEYFQLCAENAAKRV